MAWYEIYDAVFFITVISLITGSLAISFKYCLKSKCSNFSCCWGMINIDRDVILEDDIENNNDNNETIEN